MRQGISEQYYDEKIRQLPRKLTAWEINQIGIYISQRREHYGNTGGKNRAYQLALEDGLKWAVELTTK